MSFISNHINSVVYDHSSKLSCYILQKFYYIHLQTVLKLLVGDDEELLHAILIILGCAEKNMVQGKFIKAETKQNIVGLLEDTAFSHLFEVPSSFHCYDNLHHFVQFKHWFSFFRLLFLEPHGYTIC